MLFILLILFTNKPSLEQSIVSFIQRYDIQYNKDKRLRQTDSLVYIPEVMNLHKNKKYRKATIAERRERLFELACVRKLFLCYTEALDTSSHTPYSSTRGNLDYFLGGRRQRVIWSRLDLIQNREIIDRKATSLTNYIKNIKPKYIFTISDITEIENIVYWVIKNDDLYVITLNKKNFEIKEYDAVLYLKDIAPDEAFDGGRRFEYYLNNDD